MEVVLNTDIEAHRHILEATVYGILKLRNINFVDSYIEVLLRLLNSKGVDFTDIVLNTLSKDIPEEDLVDSLYSILEANEDKRYNIICEVVRMHSEETTLNINDFCKKHENN